MQKRRLRQLFSKMITRVLKIDCPEDGEGKEIVFAPLKYSLTVGYSESRRVALL